MADILNFLIDTIVDIVKSLLSVFPDSPFQQIVLPAGFSDFLGYANYIIDFGLIMKFSVTYLSAVLVWYGVRWLMRLIRYIQ